MADIAALTDLIAAEARAEGLELVRVKMMGGTSDPTLQVMAEDPQTRQLTLDGCAKLSRRLSEILDQMEAEGRDPIPGAYRLEVSSPGIDRPLTRLKDFGDWAGHEAKITLADKLDGRKQFTGDLIGADGDEIVIDVQGLGETRLPFALVHSAKLVMTNKLIAATAPLSTEGADDIQEVADDWDKRPPSEHEFEAEED